MPTKTQKENAANKFSESVAYWFLRLNGFLTIENFVIHRPFDDKLPGTRTDADIIEIRFPYKEESCFDGVLKDHHEFQSLTRPLLIFAEVKAGGVCRLNGPWTKKHEGNLDLALRFVGSFKPEDISTVTNALYTTGGYSGEHMDVKVAGFAKRVNEHKKLKHPNSLMFAWGDVTEFIYQRFSTHHLGKNGHDPWRIDGKVLWDLCKKNEEKRRSGFLKKFNGESE